MSSTDLSQDVERLSLSSKEGVQTKADDSSASAPPKKAWGNHRRNDNNNSNNSRGGGGRDDRRGGFDRRDDRRGGGGGRYGEDRRGGGGAYGDDRRGGSGGGYGGGRRGGFGGSGGRHHEENPFKEAERVMEVDTGVIKFESYDDVDIEVSGENPVKPVHSFKELGLPAALMSNVKLAQYKRPTPVQKYSVPIVCAGRDLMACAQTGSGKTAAFLLPIVAQLLKESAADGGPSGLPDRRCAAPRALVVSPTRELTAQIHLEARKFCYRTGLRSVVVYGGTPFGQQVRELCDRPVDILVATPGRLVDLMESGRITLANIRYLVLDEADRMLDLGFEAQIRHIVEGADMPDSSARQTLMFSATFPKEIQYLASSFLNDYLFLAVGRVGSATNLVTQKFIRVSPANDDKRDVLVDLLLSMGDHLTLIFVETKRNADYLEYYLTEQNFPATSIHGDRTQQEREDALRTFKSGETPFLIATNVASRGIDIRGVQHVVNMDMPNDIDEYVHRIGRTGRAGTSGVATSLVTSLNPTMARQLLDLLTEAKQEVPSWLESMTGASADGRGRNSRGGGRGGRGSKQRFGATDVRQKSKSQQQREPARPSYVDRSGFSGGGSYAGGSYAGGSFGGGSYGGSSGGGGGWFGN